MRRKGSQRKAHKPVNQRRSEPTRACILCARAHSPTLYAFDAAHHSDGGVLQLFVATAAALFGLGRPLIRGGVIVWPYPVGICAHTSPAKTAFGLLLRRRERCINSNKKSEKCTRS